MKRRSFLGFVLPGFLLAPLAHALGRGEIKTKLPEIKFLGANSIDIESLKKYGTTDASGTLVVTAWLPEDMAIARPGYGSQDREAFWGEVRVRAWGSNFQTAYIDRTKKSLVKNWTNLIWSY